MKPIIAIIGRTNLDNNNKSIIYTLDNYRKAIIYHGGIPFLLLPPQIINYKETNSADIGHLTSIDKDIIDSQLNLCQGIVMPGGDRMYDYDKYICKQANNNKIPILGICMGMQIMCNYNNENHNIKNNDDSHKKPDHDIVHEITIDKNSKLYKIIGQEKIMVNSNHNYHVSNSNDYNIGAYSDDFLIEAIEKDGFNLGVQWHPEKDYKNEHSTKIFKEFIAYTKSKMDE